jgi:hypothetical protein
MTPRQEQRPGLTRRPSDHLDPGRGEGCEVSSRDVVSDPAGLAVTLVRRDAESCVLALSGELSQRSAEWAIGAVSKALIEAGQVLIDMSGLRLTWTPAVQLFPSAVAAIGGWPGARLVLFGADAELARSLAALRVSETVPLTPDETTARQLLQRRPPVVTRHLHLDKEPSSPRRARLFLKAACRDWQLDAICDDAMLVASELVENAVAHARTSCRLNVRLDALGLTIAVRDYDYRGVLVPLTVNAAGHHDHGLFFVAAISQAWGVSPTEDGKSVWALLPATDPVTNPPRHL